jgi:hypothetical protein
MLDETDDVMRLRQFRHSFVSRFGDETASRNLLILFFLLLSLSLLSIHQEGQRLFPQVNSLAVAGRIESGGT